MWRALRLCETTRLNEDVDDVKTAQHIRHGSSKSCDLVVVPRVRAIKGEQGDPGDVVAAGRQWGGRNQHLDGAATYEIVLHREAFLV